MSIIDNVIWYEKYRPQTLKECILPKSIRTTFEEFEKSGYMPNLLLTGSSGIGKTTVAKAVVNDLGSNSMIINGSLNGGIDTLRTDISAFASSVSLLGNGRKYVILDEADFLTNATQPALRNFMEEFASGCGFILTCNYPNRIMKEVRSRCSTIDFNFKGLTPEEAKDLLKEQVERIFSILDKEKVEYDKRVVIEFYKKYKPDLRKILNELQIYSKNGKIDTGILGKMMGGEISTLIEHLKNKDLTSVRKWVSLNADTDFSSLTEDLYDELSKILPATKLPYLILNLNKYDYQNAVVSNREINMAAMMTEIMVDCFA